MAGVNGVEIKVGQVWRCRDGKERTVSERDEETDTPWVWDLNDKCSVTEYGWGFDSDEECPGDLIELVKDEKGFTIWRGGEQPVETIGKTVDYRYERGAVSDCPANCLRWTHTGLTGDIHAYKVVEQATAPQPADSALGRPFDGQAWVEQSKTDLPVGMVEGDDREYTGGSVSYYKVPVSHPTSGGDPYDAECNDLIEALGMNFAEGNAFKAIWRLCAARRGLSKRGYDEGVYDAEKVVFFGQRMVVQQKEGGA